MSPLPIACSTAAEWNNQGNQFAESQRWEEAAGCYRRALELQPDYGLAYLNQGVCLEKRGLLEEALATLLKAAELIPDSGMVYGTLATVHVRRKEYPQAEMCYRRALELAPKDALVWANWAVWLDFQGRDQDAIAACQHALTLNPQEAEARICRAHLLLSQGYLAQGWQDYEARFLSKNFGLPNRTFPRPRWKGEPLEGRRILVYGEQGYGDTIQFTRYVPLLRALGATVILECRRELLELFAGLPGSPELVVRGDALPEFDYQISLLSLPLEWKTTLERIPNQVPYLALRRDYLEAWGRRMSHEPQEGLRIGLAWAGNPRHLRDAERSIDPALLQGLAGPGRRFYSLQKNPRTRPDLPLVDWTGELENFGQTAALIAHLDLVISVDTSMAHLSGALGKKIWVLLPKPSDFRWLKDRTDSP